MASLIELLQGIVGAPNVLTAAGDMAPSLADWRGRYHGTAQAVVRPATTAELAAVVAIAAQLDVSLHHLYQALGDGQPQAGAAEADRKSVV